MQTSILDCGHAPTSREPGDIGTGYGVDYETGFKVCYECCAETDRANMIATGRATLYFSQDNGQQSRHSSRERYVQGRITNWPGSLSFYASGKYRAFSGGFGSQRTDIWFTGPDGYEWHAVNRGDSEVARCKRTKFKPSK